MTTLDPHNVATWTEQPYEELLNLSTEEVADVQQQALKIRFESLRPQLEALDKLATQQGVDRVEEIDDVLPVLFDHRVYKSYPLSLIEKRQFSRLTVWLNRLTTHDLKSVPLDGVDSVDDWLTRLDEHGMIIGHSTGTTGKLSFIPRSRTEWPAWRTDHFESLRFTTGLDMRTEKIHNFAAGYRYGHQMMAKQGMLFGAETAGGEACRHMLYDYRLSSDLLSLAGRMRAAEERGELDQLQIDPRLLEERMQLIEAASHREEDLQHWFEKLAVEFRGQKVLVGGTSADMVRLALKGKEVGLQVQFAPGSVLAVGGGFKGFKDAPANWKEVLQEFFGIQKLASFYGMSEMIAANPICAAGFFHVAPYTIPILLNEDAQRLPAAGTQTGRMAFYDLLAETYWGGFISGDRVTITFDGECACGFSSPRVHPEITRFADLAGGDDKITCAGTAKAYNDFMDYVGGA
ncbi:hypothetical protein [Mycobacterium sp. 1245805.9]|uniref:hypothetical protein n=1 Tax=Mycobacterium sp. 1245805.9 TaxID=1856862 RepID=UPI000800FAF5|nr:hypothetical protein [Mycobacterium sp. 1245805.9]OBI80347.1 hypothetical protein A9X00_00985 [Mycobacterium sp. 1245805.9]